MTDTILFSGPWIKPPGTVPHRVVLHAKRDEAGKITEYIVHDQCRSENGKLSYTEGDYYLVPHGDAYSKAAAKFYERCARRYGEQRMGFVVPDAAPLDQAFAAEKAGKYVEPPAPQSIHELTDRMAN